MLLIDEKKFFCLIRKASELSAKEDLQQFVALMKEALGLTHFTFAAMADDFSAVTDMYTTYPREWVEEYLSDIGDIGTHDPLFRQLKRLVPVQWNELTCENERDRQIMETRFRYGIGPNGFTIPFRSSDNRISVLCVSQADMSHDEWFKKTSIMKNEIFEIGEILHSAYLKIQGITPPAVLLSSRAIDCLKLRGTGMNEEESANILKISARAVKNNLKQARTRLKAANNEQALATAIHMGLIR